MFKKTGLFSSDENGISWWWLGVKIGVVAASIIWWYMENKNKKAMQSARRKGTLAHNQSIPLPAEDIPAGEPVEAGVPESTAAPLAEPDDLTKIEGIGPKINAALQEAGIRTYQQLAESELVDLRNTLNDAGIRLGQPDTWPEQAALAAKADWTGLEELQSSLQGGRRVD